MPIFWSNESKCEADPVLSNLEYPLIRNIVARIIIFVLRGNGKLICGCYACINNNPNKVFMGTVRERNKYLMMIMGSKRGDSKQLVRKHRFCGNIKSLEKVCPAAAGSTRAETGRACSSLWCSTSTHVSTSITDFNMVKLLVATKTWKRLNWPTDGKLKLHKICGGGRCEKKEINYISQ